MYSLYTAPGTAGLAVHWLLIELGQPHELHLLDLEAGDQRKPDYLALNPNGVVPTLLIDGQPVYESAALVLHLADAHPEAGLAPPPGSLARAAYYQWIVLCANGLLPAFRAWFHPNEVAGESCAEASREHARSRIEAAFARIDHHLAGQGPYLLGDTLSAADFLLTMLMRWSRNMPRPATDWPHLRALAERMKARPSFRTLYEREGLTEWR
ncbi:glutathione S-transferase family protein [Rehaibacterium terrae]|jgi:glutathione S-transferase|uniref:Glutathione S-transferase n=1 Tax=Rehaibacterium terrae TaxID=1341696 RepID=A0A7W7Y0Y3_9GAMM|nr:glutathione S-transferase family protein [Rehaibacterium terrae]MBB5016015.1 glutathione S-transferase [Rehaibacterium terrae]